MLQNNPPSVEVVIEVPRGSFLRRDNHGHVDFISPIPCPYNYGSVHEYIGGEGDFLDAIVLGPRLAKGSKVRVKAYGAVRVIEQAIHEDKLICAVKPIDCNERKRVLLFLKLYMFCKTVLNAIRGKIGRSQCIGWEDASAAIARAKPVESEHQ